MGSRQPPSVPCDLTADRPDEPCPYHVTGTPSALPLPSGYLCGGITGQPCSRCVRMALGVRGQAEFFAETMSDEPKPD